MKTRIKFITKTLAIITIAFISSCTKTPEACFTVDKGKTAKLNEEVQFNATCCNNADTYTWDYGDGTTGSGSLTKHKYPIAANYVVKLTAGNKSKSATISQDLTITP
ncbi:MAG: PKD domain-containing protein [Bacteroidia bacterium]|nr:PKD domain-containing protein [Bacteroidia bacterium]